MKFNLKEKCHEAKNKEFYYGAMLNRDIVDVYIGQGYLEPNESDKKIGPGRGHEEILYIMNGNVKVELKGEEHVLSEGEVIFIPEGLKATITNLNNERIYYIIAGGHPKPHKH